MNSVLSAASSLSTAKSASIHSGQIGRAQVSSDGTSGANRLPQLPAAEAHLLEAALLQRNTVLKFGIAAERELTATEQWLQETSSASAELQGQLDEARRRAEIAEQKAHRVPADGAPARYQAASWQHS